MNPSESGLLSASLNRDYVPSLRFAGQQRPTPFGILILGLCIVANGCGIGGETRYPVSGNITVKGEKPDAGRVFFAPLGENGGPRIQAEIVDGRYAFDGTNKLLAGSYRVELEALKSTGKKVKQKILGGESVEVDEQLPISPKIYLGSDSPLSVDVPGNENGIINLSIPGP